MSTATSAKKTMGVYGVEEIGDGHRMSAVK